MPNVDWDDWSTVYGGYGTDDGYLEDPGHDGSDTTGSGLPGE